ncbi:helix-turn-helix domain-containing protein [Candidatus Woesearchaeota archaeon]|nr:helix-turn-helix domain-containing protein [Candidatus Woesearchaeota archaeon]
MGTIDDLLDLKIEKHIDRLDYLVLVASNPDKETILRGLKLFSTLSSAIRYYNNLRNKEDTFVKAGKLAQYINDCELDGSESDMTKIADNLLHYRNSASSLEITLLFNALANNMWMKKVDVFKENDYYTPYINEDKLHMSIQLKNRQNKGKVVAFQDAKIIKTHEAIALYAKKRSKELGFTDAQKEFLRKFSDSLIRYVKGGDEIGIEKNEIVELLEQHITDYATWRKKRGISQRDLAERLGIAQSMYSYYETAKYKPSPELDMAIRYALKMPIDFENIGDEYRFYRNKLNLSQGDVSDVTGIKRGIISNYEAGHRVPNAEADKRIRDVFNLDWSYYFPSEIYRSAREEKGMTINEVAEILGITAAKYKSIEQKRIPKIYIAKKLFKIYELERFI